MNWQKFKTKVGLLPQEQQVIGAMSIVFLVSCFMPWYTEPVVTYTSGLGGGLAPNLNTEITSYSAFGSYAFIIGYCVFAFASTMLYLIAAKVFTWNVPRSLSNTDKVCMMLGAQSFFLITLALFIYTKQATTFTQASVRFGLYTSLISSSIITIYGYLYTYRMKEEITKQKEQKVFESNYRSNVQLEPEMDESLLDAQDVNIHKYNGTKSANNIYKNAVEYVKNQKDLQDKRGGITINSHQAQNVRVQNASPTIESEIQSQNTL